MHFNDKQLFMGRLALTIVFALPVLAALVLGLRAVFSLAAFFVFVAMIMPGLDWTGKKMRLSRMQAAGAVAALLGFVYFFGAFTFLPVMLKGGIETGNSLTEYAKNAPDHFQKGWKWLQSYDSLSLITQEMIDKAADWFQKRVESFVAPGTTMLAFLGAFLWKGTATALGILAVPFPILFAWAWWDWEEEQGESIARSFVPEPYDSLLIFWWLKFRDHGTRLFAAIGLSMLAFCFIFTLILLILSVKYPISVPMAVFFGVVLGITGGIPILGIGANAVITVFVGVAIFGFDWVVLFLLGVTLALQYIQVAYVMTTVAGLSLKFSTIGISLCFCVGFVLWGPSMLGIVTSLLLMPFWKATMEAMDTLNGRGGRERCRVKAVTRVTG